MAKLFGLDLFLGCSMLIIFEIDQLHRYLLKI